MPSSPANWRSTYALAKCAECHERALFLIGSIPVCDDCLSLRKIQPGLPTETVPSDIQYHGDNFGDDDSVDYSR